VAKLEVIRIPYDTPEWQKFRLCGLGGSDAAAAIGHSAYKTNIELWEEKTGARTAPDISANPRVKYGKQAEEHLTALFQLDYPQYEVIDTKDIIYKRDFLFASLDGELKEIDTGRRGFLEDKTAELNSRAAADKWAGNSIPDTYYIQILHYFLVTGFDFCKVKARLIDNDRYGEKEIREVHRHFEREELHDDLVYLYNEEKKFWGFVQAKKRPPALLPSF
jgi:putative phage-type endonuclease